MTSANCLIVSNRVQGRQVRQLAARLARFVGASGRGAATSVRMAHDLRGATTDHERRQIVDRYTSAHAAA